LCQLCYFLASSINFCYKKKTVTQNQSCNILLMQTTWQSHPLWITTWDIVTVFHLVFVLVIVSSSQGKMIRYDSIMMTRQKQLFYFPSLHSFLPTWEGGNIVPSGFIEGSRIIIYWTGLTVKKGREDGVWL
jgi:hypothetical protein